MNLIKCLTDIINDPSFGVGIFTGIISGLITGLITGLLTGLAITKHFRNRDIREEAWNYVFERAYSYYSIGHKLEDAIRTNELPKFEEVNDLIQKKFNYSDKKEFTMISEQQKEALGKAYKLQIDLILCLVPYLHNRQGLNNKVKIYLENMKNTEQKIKENLEKIREISEQWPNYDKLLIDSGYTK